jgi:hypothetical protein
MPRQARPMMDKKMMRIYVVDDIRHLLHQRPTNF